MRERRPKSADRKSLLDSVADFFAFLGVCARYVPTLSKADNEPAPTTDPDFEEWLRNDVNVVADPAHRYGDSLADSDED